MDSLSIPFHHLLCTENSCQNATVNTAMRNTWSYVIMLLDMKTLRILIVVARLMVDIGGGCWKQCFHLLYEKMISRDLDQLRTKLFVRDHCLTFSNSAVLLSSFRDQCLSPFPSTASTAQKRFVTNHHCCRGRWKPGCRCGVKHYRWQLTTTSRLPVSTPSHFWYDCWFRPSLV